MYNKGQLYIRGINEHFEWKVVMYRVGSMNVESVARVSNKVKLF